MGPDAPVKNTAGEEEIILSSVGKLERLLSCCCLQRKEKCNPQSLWSHRNQHNSAETRIAPKPVPASPGSSCPPASAARALDLTSLSHQINSFSTKLSAWLPLAGCRLGKGRHAGVCYYIALCLVFYSENDVLLPPVFPLRAPVSAPGRRLSGLVYLSTALMVLVTDHPILPWLQTFLHGIYHSSG